MSDPAPRSSEVVRAAVIRTTAPERITLHLSVTTRVTHNDRAESSVQRPISDRESIQWLWDEVILAALRKLPGAEQGVSITMGRHYTVTWDGVCAPV